MTDRLSPILAAKRVHVAAAKAAGLPDAAAGPPRGFAAALLACRAAGRTGLIAEIKKASPSRGLIRGDFDPASHARAYAAGGAACLSVLTDVPFFQGDDRYLAQARAACALPALRKDFIIDPWQIGQSRALGADAVLLIVAALEQPLLLELECAAIAAGLDVLAEVHDDAELDRALGLQTPLIGVNNRNLKTMAVDLATTARLAARVPAGRLVVGESGISGPADVATLAAAGVTTILVGESLMRQADVAAATRALLHG
jgi:indole-3-glycerol phosphate synthase